MNTPSPPMEDRYALAVQASGSGIWDWIVATDELHASPRLLEIFGLAPDTTFAGHADFLACPAVHPEDMAGWERAWAGHLAGNSEHFRHEMRMVPFGEQRWVLIMGLTTRDAAGHVVRWTGSATDITESKRAEAVLRGSEERYALALAAAEEGHWDWDVASDDIFVSPRINELFGFPEEQRFCKRAELVASVPYHPDDLAYTQRCVNEALAGRAERTDFDYRVVLASGVIRWLRARWKIARNAAGAPVRVTGVVSDITERKEANEALRESEARFRALTGLSSDWYWKQDRDLRFTYFSADATEHAGYAVTPLIGRTSWELPVTPLSCSWDEHKAVLAARRPFRDFETARIDGHRRAVYISTSGVPVFDEQGQFKGYEGVGRNITERKRIEAELRARQDMLELAQKAARAVAFDWRIDAVPGEDRWSPTLDQMDGLAAGSDAFKAWKRQVHRDDWPGVRDAIRHASTTGEFATEYRVLRPGGQVRWLQAKGRMLADEDGGPQRLVGFLLDVTDRHAAEDKLRRLERQLRQGQRLEAMGTLAGGIAHDFNNILGAILGYGEMALRDAPPGSRLRRDVDSIITAGERGRALVDRILAFSRSGVGEKVSVHVEKVAREALDQLSAQLPPKVSILSELRAGRAAMRGDPTQVHQVLMNLATNGVQAMPEGGTLRVDLAACRLDEPHIATTGTVQPGEYLVLRVADEGRGIPAGILERIFDPFFTTKEVGVGTGLGLSLVHGIVAELGGAVDVETTPAAGSVFTVYLPRHGDAIDALEVEAASQPRGRGERIMVVDDEEPLVRLAIENLSDLGYRARGFTSSEAALEAFRADPGSFDAVISDERMPGIAGTALILEIRRLRRTIPILLVSGYVGGAVSGRAHNAGADEVLRKPLAARDLAAALARLLHIG